MNLRRGRALLDRDRDGLLVFFVGVVLLRVAAAVYFLAHLLVAASPVVMLASRVAIANFTAHATRRVVDQWGGAGGAICEDHFALVRRRLRTTAPAFFICGVLVCHKTLAPFFLHRQKIAALAVATASMR